MMMREARSWIAACLCLTSMFGRGESQTPEASKITDLVANLGSKNHDTYLNAIKETRRLRIKPDAAVPLIIGHLKDSDGAVREAAAGVLGEVATPKSLAALTNAVQGEPDIWVKMSFIDAIGAHKAAAKSAIPMLASLLKDPKSYDSEADPCGHTTFSLSLRTVGCSASYALSQIGPDAAVPLAEIYANSQYNASVHEAAGAGLFALGKRAYAAKAILLQVMANGDDDSKSLVMIVLTSGFPKSADIKNGLYARLTDKSDYIRVTAAAYLAELDPDNPESVPVLIRGLKSENGSTPWRAAIELGRLGSKAKGAVPELVRLLKTSDDHLREGVVGALGDIGPAAFAAVTELKRIESDDPDEGVRSAAKKSLRQIINPK